MRKREQAQNQGKLQAEGEGEAGSLLSKEWDVGLTPGSGDHDLGRRQMLSELNQSGAPQKSS